MKPLMYLAGGMSSGWQDKVKERLKHLVRFYDPRTDSNQNCLADLTVADRDNAIACDYMLAYFEKDHPSGLGMCAEIGMAAASGVLQDKNVRIYFVDEHAHIHGFVAALCFRIYTDLDAALDRIEKDLKGNISFSWSRDEGQKS